MTVSAAPETFALAQGVLGVFTQRGHGNLAHRRPHVPAELVSARTQVAHAVGVEAGELHLMRQVHGAQVGRIGASSSRGGEMRSVDALATDQTGRALVVQAADCVPVLIAADQGPIGVAHAGRGGVTGNVVAQLVDALVDLGARAEHLHAAIGPSIGGCCYEVPAAMAREVADRVGAQGAAKVVATTTWATTSLDLPVAVAWQLAQAGVTDIRPSPGCTHCDPEARWFSHRREASTGRHAGVVVRTAGPCAQTSSSVAA
ncbi:MAG: YfiH family protein [Glaciecola sp.]